MRQLRSISAVMLPYLCLPSAFGADLQTGAHQRQFSQLGWNWDPLILAGFLIAVIAYGWGLRRMKGVARSLVIGETRCASFAVGIAALFVVLITPFEALDDELFCAHMLQHLVLMMVAPPLLILGRPSFVFLWALPLSGRRALARAWVRSGVRRIGHFAMSPVVVWLLCSGGLWFWHLPAPFRWALRSEFIHALEHICFFATALMFWSLVFQPAANRRMSYGGTLIFVATFGMQNGLLGAILTFAGRPLYGAYLPTTAAWGFTPLEDQQTAGLLMWIPASFIHLGALGFLFVGWMRAAERQAILATRRRRSVVSHGQALHFTWLAIGLLIGAGACGHAPAPPTWKIADADASRGPELIRIYGCGSCHDIPEVSRAVGKVGPPLGGFGERVYIAGVLGNTPTNLIRWLRHPQSVLPGNAMPNMDVTEKDARDLAAFLYSHPNSNARPR